MPKHQEVKKLEGRKQESNLENKETKKDQWKDGRIKARKSGSLGTGEQIIKDAREKGSMEAGEFGRR